MKQQHFLRSSYLKLLFVSLLFLVVSACGSKQGAEPISENKKKTASLVYVNNREANTVQVIDPTTYSVMSTIEVGEKPTYVGVTPDGKHAYVVNSKSEDVTIIDTTSNKVVKTVPVGKTPKGVNFTTDGKWAYVINEGEATVTVIDVVKMQGSHVINVGKFPHNGVSSPDSSTFYVTNTASNSIFVIDTGTQSVINTIEGVNGFPHNVTITPDGKTLWVTLTKSNAIGIIDLEKGKLVENIPVGKGHHVIDLTNDGKFAYVANIGDDIVTVIDTASKELVKSIKVGKGPHGIAISPDNKEVYVPVTGENKLVVLDSQTNEVVQTIETDAFPFFTATLGSHGTAYFTERSMTEKHHSLEKNVESGETSKDAQQESSKTVIVNPPLLKTDEAFTYTFNEAAEYAIHCDPHPYMTMTVMVKEGKKMDEQTVEIKDYGYMPETLEITSGTSVKWINKDSVQHNAAIEK